MINDYNTHPCQPGEWGRVCVGGGRVGGGQPSYGELHHRNNIILFLRLVDSSTPRLLHLTPGVIGMGIRSG